MTTARALILRTLAELDAPVNSTRLVKLVYLMDYIHFQSCGSTITGFKYMWDHFGPNAVGHAIVSEAQSLAKSGKVKATTEFNIHGGFTIFFQKDPSAEMPRLTPEAEIIMKDVIAQYGRLTTEVITKKTKETSPFKHAKQYEVLEMKQIAPKYTASEDDLKAYERDLKESGTISLTEMGKRRAIAN